MKIRYVIFNAYAMGGTVRTVVNQANALCERHDVEIASVYRHRETPGFQLDPRVRLICLTDLRSDGCRQSDPSGKPSRLMNNTRRLRNRLPHGRDRRFGRWDPVVDAKIVRYLRSVDEGVLVTTRPGLNLLSAMVTPRRVVRVGQDHMNLGTYKPRLRRAILRLYPRLDAVTVLTEHDRQDYARAFTGSGLRLERIPNGVPARRHPPAPLDGKLIVAAGSLSPQKGFDMLIDAYATVHAKHPDWQLRIYGSGPKRAELTEQIARLGLTDVVQLAGLSPKLDEELAKASMFVLSSRFEGLPMVLLEAMTAGLPPVAFDCPTGPAEVIAPGRSGLLVPPRDVPALAAGLCEMIEDPARRRAMAAEAMREAERYSIDAVRDRWEELFADLVADHAGRSTSQPA